METYFQYNNNCDSLETQLKEEINSNNYTEISLYVAFSNSKGLKTILDSLLKFKNRGGIVKFYCGVDLLGTTKEALEILHKNFETYIIHVRKINIVFHPKLYIMNGDSNNKLIVIGSSNLTYGGLSSNFETSLILKYDATDIGTSNYNNVINQINNFENYLSKYRQLLTQDLLDLMINVGIVISEHEKSKRFNLSITGSKPQNTALESFCEKFTSFPNTANNNYNSESKEIYPFLINVSRKKHTHKYEVKEVLHELKGQSLWIQTLRASGGCTNIFDFSVEAGINGGDSALSFFFDPNNQNQKNYNLKLKLFGLEKQSTTMYYAKARNMYRISFSTKQLKVNLNRILPGGLPDKILIFEKTEIADTYNLYIMRDSYVQDLKNISTSSDTTNSRAVTGREYGLIYPQ